MKRHTSRGRLIGAGLMMALAIGIAGSQWIRERRLHRHEQWPTTAATVTDTEVYATGGVGRYSGPRHLHIEVTARYTIDGSDYEETGDVINLGNTADLDSRLPPGELIDVFYNPRDPREFVHDIGDVYLEYTNLMPLAALLAFVAVALAGVTLRRDSD